jgi:hypothetical protein
MRTKLERMLDDLVGVQTFSRYRQRVRSKQQTVERTMKKPPTPAVLKEVRLGLSAVGIVNCGHV